jgi:uncharacterized protein (DUF1800 family)
MIGAAVPTRISAPQQNVVRCHAAWAAPTRVHHHTALDANSHARRSVSTRTVSSPTALAAHRFGFGASDADLAAASGDARGWLAGQLDTTSADKALLAQSFGALPGSDRTGSVFPSMLRRAGLMGGLGRAGGGVAASAGTGESRALRQLLPYLQAELEARMRHAVATPTPLVDRLVWFWSNHLTVSARRIGVYALVGPYEREAIRPHVLGRFEDLLLAAAKHPAMQIYLDNFRSVGPNTSAVGSGFGAQRRTGVNENLARELLELHTLGDRSAYTQADVGQLALALTGWGLGFGTGFRYDDSAHEPGTRTLLQRRYDQHGQQQAEAMLIDLARHPATARHLARKLLRHFGAATPSATEVERVAQIYLQSGGQLRTVMLAVLDSADVWRTDGLWRRARHADELAAGAWRTLGIEPPSGAAIYAQLESLGAITWLAGSPAGWTDQSLDALGPDALLARLDWGRRVAERAAATLDARALARERFGPLLGDATRRELERAASGAQALALLLASPELLQA